MENSETGRKRRIMLTVAYDGTNYHGWQIQPESITIEKVLNECLSSFLHEEISVIGASRTDAGVHAFGNLCVFDTDCTIPAERFPNAINALLPDDIKIQKGQEVELDFHPRKCDTRKTYEYHILNTDFDNPVYNRYSTHVYGYMDIDKMNEAGHYLVGEHDFTSFCSINAQALTRVRTLYDINVQRRNDEIVISVTGNGFLYNMVRIIAGTLIDVGRGHTEPEKILSILNAKDRALAGPTAPAKGLILKGYAFEKR